jgi:2-amino-4-hydroxy-6-hydroxymethyldihydropteridine diphosphokinase
VTSGDHGRAGPERSGPQGHERTRRAYLGIGSNLGDRLGHLQLAVDRLARAPGVRITGVSPVYETDPVGGPVQDDFLNAVVGVDTDLTPDELLAECAAAEAAAARVRDVRWGPRTLDVDVLWIEGYTSTDPVLTVPHPRMAERAFVLAPLHDLDPMLAPSPAGGWEGVRRAPVALRVP